MENTKYNKSGSRMLISTGFKKFDKASNYISYGNVFSNTQTSSVITYWSNTKRCGKTFAEGELLKKDLSMFKIETLGEEIRNILFDKNRKNNVFLYKFFIKDEIIGYILTDNLFHFLASKTIYYYGASYFRRNLCIESLKKYVCCDGTFEVEPDVKHELFNQLEIYKDSSFSVSYETEDYSYSLRHKEVNDCNETINIDEPYIVIRKKSGKLVDIVKVS